MINMQEDLSVVDGVSGVFKELVFDAQTPTAGVYTLDASSEFSSINAIMGWRIHTQAANVNNNALTTLHTFSGTTVSIHAVKPDYSAATDATIRYAITLHGVSA
jgi:hypothetical protein